MSEATTNIQAVEPVKPYALRALEARDVFIMSKIIKSIGIAEFRGLFESEEIKTIMEAAEKEAETEKQDNVASVGMAIFFNIADIVLNNIPKCEKDIYTFLSSLSGMKEKQIESLPMNTFIEMIIDVVQKEEFKDFIQVVSKLFK